MVCQDRVLCGCFAGRVHIWDAALKSTLWNIRSIRRMWVVPPMCWWWRGIGHLLCVWSCSIILRLVSSSFPLSLICSFGLGWCEPWCTRCLRHKGKLVQLLCSRAAWCVVLEYLCSCWCARATPSTRWLSRLPFPPGIYRRGVGQSECLDTYTQFLCLPFALCVSRWSCAWGAWGVQTLGRSSCGKNSSMQVSSVQTVSCGSATRWSHHLCVPLCPWVWCGIC